LIGKQFGLIRKQIDKTGNFVSFGSIGKRLEDNGSFKSQKDIAFIQKQMIGGINLFGNRRKNG